MKIECPQCESNEFTKRSLVYAQGFSALEARSHGWGLVFGAGGAGIRLGSAKTKGRVQPRLSQRFTPPHKRSYWKIILWWLVGLLPLEFLLGYLDMVLGHSA
ncbi:MAG TPA: hypothetical protein VGX94_19455 [Terriglobia bacterium]|nr:hypothetical protein [Terriglobia bacterium]